MSNLYGVIRGAAKTAATQRGHDRLEVVAASWRGSIRTEVLHRKNGDTAFNVYLEGWQNTPRPTLRPSSSQFAGGTLLASGVLYVDGTAQVIARESQTLVPLTPED